MRADVLGAIVIVVCATLAACSDESAEDAGADSASLLTVYKSPTCDCCGKWIDHVDANGLRTKVEEEQDMGAVQTRLGVPAALQSCHVAVAGEYLIVGHVPAEDIQRLLNERPKARGLSVPGMPTGSPGMEHGDHMQPYDTLLFQADGQSSVFAHHGDQP